MHHPKSSMCCRKETVLIHSSSNSFQSTTPTYPTTSHIPWNKTHFKTLFFCLFSCLNIHINDTDRVCVCMCLFLCCSTWLCMLKAMSLFSPLCPFALFSSLSLKQSLWASGLAGFKCSQTPLQWSRLSPTPFVAPSDRTSPLPLSLHHPYQSQPNVCSSQNIRVTVSTMTVSVPMMVWGCKRCLWFIILLL